MRTKDFLQIERRLPPEVSEGLTFKEKLCIVAPFRTTLRGFVFESSAFSAKEFYMTTFLMPLCVPAKRVHTTFGHRLASPERWRADDPGLVESLSRAMQEEMPSLRDLDSPERVLSALEPLTRRTNPHVHEAFSYVLLLAGQPEAAIASISDLMSITDPSVAWQREIRLRAGLIQRALASSVEEARDQLAEWEIETVTNLRVEALRQ